MDAVSRPICCIKAARQGQENLTTSRLFTTADKNGGCRKYNCSNHRNTSGGRAPGIKEMWESRLFHSAIIECGILMVGKSRSPLRACRSIDPDGNCRLHLRRSRMRVGESGRNPNRSYRLLLPLCEIVEDLTFCLNFSRRHCSWDRWRSCSDSSCIDVKGHWVK